MAEVPLYEAMQTLRAVRRLRPDPIPDEVIRRVLFAACQAPTGGNRQPFRILVVRDRAKLAALARLYADEWHAYVAFHREQTKGAPEAVRAEDERLLASGNHLADHFGALPALLVFCFDPRQMAITDAGLSRVSVVGGASIYQTSRIATRIRLKELSLLEDHRYSAATVDSRYGPVAIGSVLADLLAKIEIEGDRGTGTGSEGA